MGLAVDVEGIVTVDASVVDSALAVASHVHRAAVFEDEGDIAAEGDGVVEVDFGQADEVGACGEAGLAAVEGYGLSVVAFAAGIYVAHLVLLAVAAEGGGKGGVAIGAVDGVSGGATGGGAIGHHSQGIARGLVSGFGDELVGRGQCQFQPLAVVTLIVIHEAVVHVGSGLAHGDTAAEGHLAGAADAGDMTGLVSFDGGVTMAAVAVVEVEVGKNVRVI